MNRGNRQGIALAPPLESAEDLEYYLLRQRSPALSALSFPSEMVLPNYELSIANLPATLAAILGAQLPGAEPPLPAALWADLAEGVQRVVWVLFDAVGWFALRNLLAQEGEMGLAGLAHRGRLMPITSVYPTTTTSALTTLWTGYAPARHGLVGHMMYLREYGLIADMLMLSPSGAAQRDELPARGLDLQTFLPVPGLAEAVAPQGVVTCSLINVDLARTGFSRLCFRGVAETVRFVAIGDLCVLLRQALRAHKHERQLLVAYLAEPDSVGHLQGAETDAWAANMRALDCALQREFLDALTPEERRGTLVVMTADHGQLPGKGSPVILSGHRELWDDILLPATGSLRAAYLYARQGRLEAAERYLHERLAEQFFTVRSIDALRAGLLGPGEPARETPYRLGDLVVTARDNYLLDYRQRTHLPQGLHAGLEAVETLVPFLVARLD